MNGRDLQARRNSKKALKRTLNYNSLKDLASGQRIASPKFTKYANNPIFTHEKQSWISSSYEIYYPCMIEVRSILGNAALDNFYLYYSTDHHGGIGGIGLATAPTPTGPFTDRGRIFYDNTSGKQTETPEVRYNEKTGKFHLYYSQAYANEVYRSQATALALSDDGVNFTVHKSPLIALPVNEYPGDAHTGYARIYRLGDLWIMRHLMGGTDYSHQGLSYSYDGINFITDPRPVIGNAEWATDGSTRKTGVNDIFRWRGQYWANVNDNAWVSGTNSAPTLNYISPYGGPRFPGSGLYPTVTRGDTGSFDEKSIRNISFFEYEDTLYMLYEGVNAAGKNSFGIAVSEV